MARGLSIRLRMEDCRELAFGSITAAYASIETAVENPIRAFLIQNMTDAAVWISTDGLRNKFPLMANGYLMFDVTANKTQNAGFYLAEGDRLYCKRLGTPTSGSVYFSAFYGS